MAEDNKFTEDQDIQMPKLKKSTGRIFWQSLFIDDFSLVKDHLLFDVLQPAISNLIIEGVCSTVSMIFNNGDPRKGYFRRSGRSQSPLSQFYKDYNITRTTQTGVLRDAKKNIDEVIYNRKATVDYMDIPFETPGDAEEAIMELRDILEEYKRVSVADFYDVAEKINSERTGMPVNYDAYKNYTCNNFGWTDLSNVMSTYSRGKWYLTLTRAIPIK